MKAPLSNCRNRETVSTRKVKDTLEINNTELGGIAILPDEIIIAIVSCLALKEAGRTSVLSRRWRDLWKFTSGSLDFARRDARTDIRMGATRFVTLVNQVLNLHQGPRVDKLSICYGFPMGKSSPTPIDSWIRFAIQKEVKFFELESVGRDFPELEKFVSIWREVKPRSSHCSLMSVRLVDVDVKDDIIEYLLSKCPCLEQLTVERSAHTKHLKVVGPSLMSLVVARCRNLEELEISAANLVSFEYSDSGGYGTRVLYKSVPLLSELSISGPYCESFFWLPQKHSGYCCQLKKLVLNVHHTVIADTRLLCDSPIEFPQLQCLKQLELVLFGAAGESFLFFVLWTKACPFLSRILVKFEYMSILPKETMNALLYPERENFLAKADFYHKCLKVVTLVGFGAYRGDMVFALAFLRIAKSLEKLIIRPYGYYYYERVIRVRESAKVLEANLPHGAALVIL